MFFYSKGSKFNVLLTLDQIEAAVILLASTDAPLQPEYAKRHAWARAVSDAMLTKGKIHLIVAADKNDATLRGFRGPLSALPQPYRKRTADALTAIAVLFQHPPRLDDVDCIGEGAIT